MSHAPARPTTRAKLTRLLSARKLAVVVFGLLLGLGGYLLGAAGGGGSDPAEERAAVAAAEAEAGGASFLSAERREQVRAEAAERGRSAWQTIGPHLARLGVSLAAGLVVGIFFRAFLVKAAAMTALALAGLLVLAYFEQIDFSVWRANVAGAGDAVRANAGGLRDVALSLVPSTTGAVVGFALGFMRK